jgi:hypothetical protein
MWGAVLAAAVVLLVAIQPGPRNAVADLLGLPGIRIELTDRDTTDDVPTSIGSSLLFGERTTLAGAMENAPFTLKVPGDESLGDPDEVWMRISGDVTVVSLVYGEREDLPEIGETGVGMLLMQIHSGEDAPFLAKRASRFAPPESVTVNGEGGFWIENGELVVLPSEFTGDQGMTRPSGNVLIWADNGVTWRMETALEMNTAIRIAESLESAGEGRSGNQIGMAIVGEVAALRSSSGRHHHESSSLSCRHARRTVRLSDQPCPRRRLGIHPPRGAAAGRLRG